MSGLTDTQSGEVSLVHHNNQQLKMSNCDLINDRQRCERYDGDGPLEEIRKEVIDINARTLIIQLSSSTASIM